MSTSPTVSEKENSLARDKRNALTDLAIGLIAEGGLAALTYRSLAAAAGVSVGSIQAAFPNRFEILDATFDRAWSRAGMQEGEEKADNPREKLFEVCSRAVPAEDPPDPSIRAYFEILSDATRDPDTKTIITEIELEGEKRYLELIRRAQEAGEIDPGHDPQTLIDLIWSLGDGLCIAAYTYPKTFTPQRVRNLWTEGFEAILAPRS
jgi:AcrR family transcriptional regulator